MTLLHEIQASVVQEGTDLGSVLLKLRLLASRLGSEYLEEWVKHESEGYPADTEVPSYRTIEVSYRGTFSGPFGSGIQNAPIPPFLVKKYAGEHWVRIQVRESIAAIGELAKSTQDSDGGLGIDASNLILLLQGKLYEGYACNDVQGSVSVVAMSEILQAVRSRILELTLQLEKSIPAAAEVTFGQPKISMEGSHERVQQITQQIIYGDVGTAMAGGQLSKVDITIQEGDSKAFVAYLVDSGIPESDASELAAIIETEQPQSAEEPLGTRAKAWLTSNLRKAAEGTWKIGITVATKVISEAALRYYGFK